MWFPLKGVLGPFSSKTFFGFGASYPGGNFFLEIRFIGRTLLAENSRVQNRTQVAASCVSHGSVGVILDPSSSNFNDSLEP